MGFSSMRSRRSIFSRPLHKQASLFQRLHCSTLSQPKAWDSKNLAPGMTTSMKRKWSSDDVIQFSSLCEDRNPIHLDEEFAKTTQFGTRIVHGMLTSSLVSATVATNVPGAIYLQQSLSFKAPVYLDETIEAKIKVRDVKRRVVTLETICEKEDGTIVLEGEGKIML